MYCKHDLATGYHGKFKQALGLDFNKLNKSLIQNNVLITVLCTEPKNRWEVNWFSEIFLGKYQNLLSRQHCIC